MENSSLKTRKLGISFKMVLCMIIATIVTGIIIVVQVINLSTEILTNTYKDEALSIAKIVADNVDGDAFDRAIQNGPGEDFDKVHAQLSTFLKGEVIKYVYTCAVDEKGKYHYVVDSDPNKPADWWDMMDDQPEIKSALGGVSAVTEEPVEDDWGLAYNAFAPVWNSKGKIIGVVGVDVDAHMVDKQSHRMINCFLVAILVCIGFACVAGVFIFIKQSKEFSALNNAVLSVASADGDLTQRLDVKSGDELEVIANNLNKLLEKTQITIRDVKDGNGSFGNIIQNINSDMHTSRESVSATNTSLENISANIEEIAANIELSSADADSIYGTSEMVRNIVSQNTKAVEEISGESQKLYISTKRSTEDANRHLREIREQMEEEKEKAQAVDKIAQLSDAILRIAKQTNLLSLNASIEAARAGDAGRGFAVVATEINGLAESSSKAATEIQQVSKAVNDAINGFLGITDTMMKLIDDMVEKDYTTFEDTSKRFKESTVGIKNDMIELDKMMKNYFASIESISSSIRQIAAASEHNAKEVVEVSQNINSLESALGQTVDATDGAMDTMKAINKNLNTYTV